MKYRKLITGERWKSGDQRRWRDGKGPWSNVSREEFGYRIMRAWTRYGDARRPIKTRSRTITKGFNRDAPATRKCRCPIGRKCTWSRADGQRCTMES
jgi:hypothetical protein